MKHIKFSLRELEGMRRFVELASLTVEEQYIDGTSQDGQVTWVVSGEVEKAKSMYLKQDKYIYTMYGVYYTMNSDIERLFKAMESEKINSQEKLQKITEELFNN